MKDFFSFKNGDRVKVTINNVTRYGTVLYGYSDDISKGYKIKFDNSDSVRGHYIIEEYVKEIKK